MKIIKTSFKNLLVIENKRHLDYRGEFRELIIEKKIKNRFPFNVISKSKKNVVRGLHYQLIDQQGKFVSVIKGEILDVAVDIRKNSKTYGSWVAEILSAKNKKQLWIPEGFAHGFYVLSDEAEVVYKVNQLYSKQHERVIHWSNNPFKIEWPITNNPVLLSKKDNNS